MLTNEEIKEFEKIEEAELWKKLKGEVSKTEKEKIREYLTIKYLPLVRYVVSKIYIKESSGIEDQDLVQWGVEGLLDAIDKYDPSQGTLFKTYAVTRIRGAIIDGLRNMDVLPRSLRHKEKELLRTISELEYETGKAPDDEEIAKKLGISVEELHKLYMQLSMEYMAVSIYEPINTKDANSMTIEETLEGKKHTNPELMVRREEIKKRIVKAIEELPEREKIVLILYYYENLTLKEIGEVLGITESRVSQLHSKAIARLKTKLEDIIASSRKSLEEF